MGWTDPTTWLVAVTGLLALATAYLAFTTSRSERHTRKQLELTSQDFEARRRAAAPLLDVAVDDFGGNDRPVKGKVRYAAGADPALDVRVWIWPGNAAFGIEHVGTVSPHRNEVEFPGIRDSVESRIEDEPWPFPETVREEDPDGWFVGLTWKELDGGEGRYIAVYFAAFNPETPMLVIERWNEAAR